MDKEAQKIANSAQQERLDMEKEIAANIVNLREEMLERARRRIAVNRETESAMLEEKWQKTKADYESRLQNMEKLFSEKRTQWADELVSRVLSGQ